MAPRGVVASGVSDQLQELAERKRHLAFGSPGEFLELHCLSWPQKRRVARPRQAIASLMRHSEYFVSKFQNSLHKESSNRERQRESLGESEG